MISAHCFLKALGTNSLRLPPPCNMCQRCFPALTGDKYQFNKYSTATNVTAGLPAALCSSIIRTSPDVLLSAYTVHDVASIAFGLLKIMKISSKYIKRLSVTLVESDLQN